MRAQAGPARSRALRRGGGLLALTVLVTGLFGASLPPAHADGTPPPEAFILVDAKTGSIITGRHLHEALSPPSTAQIMTALVAAERPPPDARIHPSSDPAGPEALKIGEPAGPPPPVQGPAG